MTPAQALAHYSTQMEMVLGQTFPPRSVLGRIFGRRAKAVILSENPFARNVPTDKYFLVVEERDFETERKRVRMYWINSSREVSRCAPEIRIAFSAR